MRQIKVTRKETNHHRWSITDEKILHSERESGKGFSEIRNERFPERSEKSLSEKARREGWKFRNTERWTDELRNILIEKRLNGLSFSDIAKLEAFQGFSENAIKIEHHRLMKMIGR